MKREIACCDQCGDKRCPHATNQTAACVQWFGDNSDGIEIRRQAGEIDEILVYRDGVCVVHIEAMSDCGYWMLLTSNKFQVEANYISKKPIELIANYTGPKHGN